MKGQKKKKRRQMVLAPKTLGESFNSNADTVPMDISIEERQRDVEDIVVDDEGNADDTFMEAEIPGGVESGDELSDLEEEEAKRKEDDPLRDDVPIQRGRWSGEETDALMTALNCDRDAIKFHFDGPGGGREVKRQAWRDVACMYTFIFN